VIATLTVSATAMAELIGMWIDTVRDRLDESALDAEAVGEIRDR
jgi:hypothetical protein